MKTCTRCSTEKALDDFPDDKRTRDGKNTQCRSCVKAKNDDYYEANKEKWKHRELRLREADPAALTARQRKAQAKWRATSKEKIKARYLKTRYGITYEQFKEMEQVQGGLCKICGKPPAGGGRGGAWDRLHVDHCHTTGKVRGLLCFLCNGALGNFRDDPDLLLRAIEYLRCTP